jgi:succinate-semialdehyde dehydrogenase / glutarate-semialdehyde dehydrogenase
MTSRDDPQGSSRDYPHIGLLIDGEWLFDRASCHEVRNPSTEATLGPVPAASAEDLNRALEAARIGFEVWRKTSPAARSELLHRVAGLMRQRVDSIARAITLEQGKPLFEAKREVLRSSAFLDWDAEQLLRNYPRIVPGEPPVQQFVVREPVGPIAAFTPWNVPLSAPARKISASLAAGCSVIIKPAEETPAAACLFAQCFLDAGLPPAVLGVVFGDPADVSRRLIASPVIRMITLTGSIAVGKHLTRLAAAEMKPVLMELGGHAPVLIDEDVDPIAVARLAATAKFRMAGQLCVSPARFLVHRNVYREFVESFADAANALTVGDGFDPAVQVGPVANERRLGAVTALVENAVGCGARVAAGGRRIGNRGYFYSPTVLADVPLEADVMSVEPFGPLAACRAIDDTDEGLTIANALPVGLAAYVFSNSPQRADELAGELQCGAVAINNFGSPGADAPFGGYKQSGIGREGGVESLDSYQLIKTITKPAGRV